MNRPNTETLALMDAARRAHGDCTDYRLARMLGVQTSNTSGWRKGRHMSDEYAAKCAALAGLDPVETVLRVAAERESGVTQEILRAALKRIGPPVASILLALVVMFVGAARPVSAAVAHLSSAAPSVTAIYIMRSLARWLARRLADSLNPPPLLQA